MNTSLVVSGLELANASATEQARAKRDALVADVHYLEKVSSPETAQAAATLLAEIKNFTRVVEAGRSDAKAPILDLGKRVDALAKELTLDLESAAAQISKQIGAFQAEQNRIAEENRRKAWEEEQRILREAQEKEVAAEKERAEAERLRLEKLRIAEKEAAEKASRARTDAGRERAEAEAEAARSKAAEEAEAARIRDEAEAKKRDEAVRQRVVETRVNAAALAPAKPTGVAVRKNICFEVTDVVALYEASPALVILSPNNAAIKAVLKGNPGKTLPGVRAWEENAAVVR